MFLDAPVVLDKISSRIFHGEKVLPTQRPYQVRLEARSTCGGSLIKTDWVLTAAHCLMEDKNCKDEKLYDIIMIQAGIVDEQTNNPDEIQKEIVCPTELNKNVFFASFKDWISECKESTRGEDTDIKIDPYKLRGYGTSKYLYSDTNLVI